MSLVLLGNRLGDQPCDVLSSNMRVQVAATGLHTYPDVVVVCGPPRFTDDHSDTLLNPVVIVEVLSPSTEAYDRGDKFAHYRTIESLTDYIMIAQDKERIEHYVRLPDGTWVMHDAGLQGGKIALDSLDCELSVADVYRRVNFPVDANSEAASEAREGLPRQVNSRPER